MKASSDLARRVSVGVTRRARSLFAWSERTRSPWPEVVVVGVIAVVLAWLVRDAWFFGDDWAFFTARRMQWNDGQWKATLLEPHNEHLSALPVLVYVALWSTVGIGSALPYLLIVVAGHVALLWALRTVLVRLDVPLWARIVAIVWFGWFGAGAENLVWPFQMGFICGFALAVWGLLLATGATSVRRDVTASVLFLAGLATASTALSVVIVGVVVVVLASRSVVRLVRVFVVPLGLYALWYLAYGRDAPGRIPVSTTSIVPYFTRGITFGLDRTVQFTGLGLVLGLAALSVVAVTEWFDAARRRAVAALAATIGVFYLMSAIGRGALGVEQSTAPRYVYFCGFAAIAVLCPVAVALMRWRPALVPIVGVLAVVAVLGNATALVASRNERYAMTVEHRWKFAVAALYVDDALVDDALRPEPVYAPNVSIAALRSLRQDGLWSPGVAITARMVVDGATEYGLRRYGSTRPDAPPMRIASTGDAAVARVGDCVTLTPSARAPTVRFAAGSGAFSLESADGPAALRFRSVTDPDVVSSVVELDTDDKWYALLPVGATGELTLSAAGPTTMCGTIVP